MANPQAITATALGVEELEHHVETLGRSKHRLEVFRAIYAGKKDPKTVSYLMEKTGLGHTDVLRAGQQLAEAHVVEQVKVGEGRGETAYRKTSFAKRNRDKILKGVENPAAIKSKATIRRPATTTTRVERIEVPAKSFEIEHITIDDIDSFRKVEGIEVESAALVGLSESQFKNGVRKVIGEEAVFKDWGGEKSDLMTTRLRLGGKRVSAAFAFKGPGQPGKLVPAKMGKNGDQCQRLFQEEADVFVVQHWREIDASVLELVATFAKVKSIASGRLIYYCLIDGQDSQRIVAAYPQHFSKTK